jgi:hypothetical protein
MKSEHVAAFQNIFAVHEPGQGGDTFINGVRERLRQIGFGGNAFEFSLGDHKDPSALYCDDPERFPERFKKALNHATIIAPEASGQVKNSPLHLNVCELLTLEIPPREMVLDPIFRERDSMMIFSWRGVGKTTRYRRLYFPNVQTRFSTESQRLGYFWAIVPRAALCRNPSGVQLAFRRSCKTLGFGARVRQPRGPGWPEFRYI